MSSETLEIQAQEDGTIVVKRVNDDLSEPVFTFKIEESSSQFSSELKMDIAQVMAEAGIKRIAEIEHSAFFSLEEEGSAATWH